MRLEKSRVPPLIKDCLCHIKAIFKGSMKKEVFEMEFQVCQTQMFIKEQEMLNNSFKKFSEDNTHADYC